MIQTVVQLVLAVATLSAATQISDVNGRPFRPYQVEGKVRILFFLSAECPISRVYAPEIQRICDSYMSSGVRCGLVYEDRGMDADQIRKRLDEFGYRGIPAVLDSKGKVAKETGISITPQVVVLDDTRTIRYRGRIDNFYADLGKPRRQVTVHDLRDSLDAVLAGRAVLDPETEAVGCFISR